MSKKQEKKIRKMFRKHQEKIEGTIVQKWRERTVSVLTFKPRPFMMPKFIHNFLKRLIVMQVPMNIVEDNKQEEKNV